MTVVLLAAAGVVLFALGVYLAHRFVRPWFGEKLPPLRGEPVNFPAVGNVPVDVDEKLELEARAAKLERDGIELIEKARARRAARKGRANRKRLPTVDR